MAITKAEQDTFHHLQYAIEHGGAAVVQTNDKHGNRVALVCEIVRDGPTYNVTPLAQLVADIGDYKDPIAALADDEAKATR